MEDVKIEVAAAGIAVGWVVADGCRVGESSSELLAELRAAVERAVAAKDTPESAARKSAARDMLRHGSYKPTGRGKPASEYLLNAAAEGTFPIINNVVDINNLVSVGSLLPISLVDLDLAGTRSFRVRRGRDGEEYVFNQSGQILSLRDLLLTAALPDDRPCATPIKDSQATKTRAETTSVLGLIYSPSSLASEARSAARKMMELITQHCGGATTSGIIIA